MRLYLDTNTYLSSMGPTSDIQSLKKLKKLIWSKKIILVLPSHTKKEFLKHVKERISEEKTKLNKAEMLYSEPKEFKKKKKKKYSKIEKSIISKVNILNKEYQKYKREQILAYKEHINSVDQLLSDIFSRAHFFEYSDEIVIQALIRYAKNLPPKKADFSFGDAINWETLKYNIVDDAIAIVSTDPDYCEQRKDGIIKINKILEAEWKGRTKKPITLYKYLGEFLNSIDKKNKISKETIAKEAWQTKVIDKNPVSHPGIEFVTKAPQWSFITKDDGSNYLTLEPSSLKIDTKSHLDAGNYQSILSQYKNLNNKNIPGAIDGSVIDFTDSYSNRLKNIATIARYCSRCFNFFIVDEKNSQQTCPNCDSTDYFIK